jgi:uncharacterized cupin superfamily protein
LFARRDDFVSRSARMCLYGLKETRMTTTSKHIAKTRIDATTWEPYPLPPEIIVDGVPDAKVHWLRASGAGEPAYYAGVWTVEPCTFDYTFEMNETAHIVEGNVVVTQTDGPKLELGPGDVATFPKGARTRWHVRARLKKVFVDTP